MYNRWYLVDFRYLAIPFTLEGADLERTDNLIVLIFDTSARSLFAVHCASSWRPWRLCGNFVLIYRSFARFELAPDHLETIDDELPPARTLRPLYRLSITLGIAFIGICAIRRPLRLFPGRCAAKFQLADAILASTPPPNSFIFPGEDTERQRLSKQYTHISSDQLVAR